jgi:hypothetical protein
LAQGIALARTYQNTELKPIGLVNYKAPGGSVVVLDADTGGVVAMASNPTYAPSEFVGGISQSQYAALAAPAAAQPLLNRATQGLYALGSTFKLVSAIAAVRYNFRGEFTPIQDPGFLVVQGQQFRNANGESHGSVDLRKALTVSSDVYFYTFGNEMWDAWKSGDVNRGYAIQQVARQFGFGQTTGIALTESQQSRVPDATWKAKFAKTLYPKGSQALAENSAWNPGDDIELAVGQGDRDAVTACRCLRGVRQRRHPLPTAGRFAHHRRGHAQDPEDRPAEAPEPYRHRSAAAQRAAGWIQRRRERPEGYGLQRVRGLPARAVSRVGEDRYRAGRQSRCPQPQ